MDKKQARQFLKIVSELPEEVQFYFSIDLSEISAREIIEKYNLDKEVFDKLFFAVFLNNFNFNLLEQEINKLKLPDIRAKQLFLDIVGIIFLPLDDYLEINVHDVLVNKGGDVEDYEKYVVDFKIKIERHALDLINDYVDEYLEGIDIDNEKKVLKTIFTNHVLEILKEKNVEALRSLNSGILYLLNNDPETKKEIDELLRNNQEKITALPIVVKNKELVPTVGNWLQAFIKKVGLEKYNEMAVANYLARSDNAKKLSENERDLVHRLIFLYINIHFYPDSMAEKQPSEWNIVPLPIVEKNTLELSKQGGVSNIKNTDSDFNSSNNIEENLEKQESEAILKLKQEINNYPEGSLERLVLEEELKKLQQK